MRDSWLIYVNTLNPRTSIQAAEKYRAGTMHISDVADECANECLRLARTGAGLGLATELANIARRLLEAAHRDAELMFEDDDGFAECDTQTAAVRGSAIRNR